MSTTVRNALPRNLMLEEYRIESVLGQGGFGITYLALDTNLDKKVAIKEYLPLDLALREGDSDVVARSTGEESDYLWGLQQFLQEAKVLGRFHHPNIAPVLRFFEANGTGYIVMAYLEGESLAERLDAGEKFDEAALKAIVFPLLDGLETVHKSGYLHRDVKPDNIFLSTEEVPVLLDFGAARLALQDKSRSLTAIVTRGYAPFEQYSRTGDQGAWTDIYALAAVMYRVVSGDEPPEATARVGKDSIIPAVQAGKGRFEEGFLAAIDRALSVEVGGRPQTIAKWRKELGAASVTRPAKTKKAKTLKRRSPGGGKRADFGTIRLRAGEAVSTVVEVARSRPRAAGLAAGFFGLVLVGVIWLAAGPAGPEPVDTGGKGEGAKIAARSARLKTLFTGGSISFSRGNSLSGEWTFGRGGRLSGTFVQEEMNEDITSNARGKWWVKGGRLCVKWRAWDGGKAHCYRITGKGRRYRAAGSSGVLRGDFQLDRAHHRGRSK